MAATRNRFNEGKALDAVIRRIEAREGCRRADDGRSPEREGHAAPVDFVCSIGGPLFAFEHTGIEPFPNQIQMVVDNERLLQPVVDRFDGALPKTEFWKLHIPVEATRGMKPPDLARARRELTRWIEERAATFPLVPYGDRYGNSSLGETVEGVPFRVSLHRWEVKGPLGGRFRFEAVGPSDLENARRTRLRRACEDKFGKLAAWKRDRNARTVLVLEENDLFLTNHWLVADALSLAEAGMTNSPDEIFLVSTELEDVWWVTCLRRDGKSYYDDGERFAEVDPGTLVAVTNR